MRGIPIFGAVLLLSAVQTLSAQTPTTASAEWEIHLQRAAEQFDWYFGLDPEDRLALETWLGIQETISEGEFSTWRGEPIQTPAELKLLLEPLRYNRAALGELRRAMESGVVPMDFEERERWDSSSDMHMLPLFLFEAFVRAQGGQRDAGLEQATLALEWCIRAKDEQIMLVDHLFHCHRMQKCLRAISNILSLGGFSTESLTQLNSVLSQPSDDWGLPAILRGDVDNSVPPNVAEHLTTQASREAFFVQRTLTPPSPGRLHALAASMEEILEARDQLHTLLAKGAAQPLWEAQLWRRDLRDQITSDPLIQSGLGLYTEAFARSVTARTMLKLVGQQVDVLLETGAMRVDPFTGNPLRMDGKQIWSLGPDTEDQGGLLVYDPTNGTLTPGDIVVPRPPETRN